MIPALEVRALSVSFDGGAVAPVSTDSRDAAPRRRAGLANVQLAVQAGDCLAVLGVSGSGKSSLLRTLAGLQPASSGQVLVKGRDVSTSPPELRGIVYLHQEPVLFPHLTVLGNVAFPMRVRGVDAREADRRALQWLSTLQVGELHGNRPATLSGGQRHRVALARALAAEPDVLLLDEPLASLDPVVREDIRVALQAARGASGAAMILVTHDLDDALAIASQIAAIGHGTLTAAARPTQMLESPPDLETARLLGVYAEIPGTVRESDGLVFQWIGGSVPAIGAVPGRVVACVRSHELTIGRGDQMDAPVLTVVERKEKAHETRLTLQSIAGEVLVVRTGSGNGAAVGDLVQVAITNARFFPPG